MGYPLRPLEPLRLVAGAEQWQLDGRGYRLGWDEEGARGAWTLHMCLQVRGALVGVVHSGGGYRQDKLAK